MQGFALICLPKSDKLFLKGGVFMAKNYLLEYSEQLATEIEMLCRNIKAPSNTIFQIRKSSSIVYANIREANYGQSKADMLSKFEIALKECTHTLFSVSIFCVLRFRNT
ncbi:MAG TPA: four helix bundle protein [Methanocorpusculum sp.]|nr:four helix bundle protein [Methanocorpusculum sp.]